MKVSAFVAEQPVRLEQAEQLEHDHDNDDDSNDIKNISIHDRDKYQITYTCVNGALSIANVVCDDRLSVSEQTVVISIVPEFSIPCVILP